MEGIGWNRVLSHTYLRKGFLINEESIPHIHTAALDHFFFGCALLFLEFAGVYGAATLSE
jgi:hypothetical protein